MSTASVTKSIDVKNKKQAIAFLKAFDIAAKFSSENPQEYSVPENVTTLKNEDIKMFFEETSS